ncbi:MAG: hypothetical protein EPO09_21225, partial [Aquabacterium sp.]
MQAYFKSTAYTANASDRRAYVQLKLNTLPRAYVFPNESYDAFFAAYASDKKTTVHESVGYFAMLIIDTVSDETIVHKLQTYLSSAIVRVQPHHLHCAYDAQAKRAYFFNMYLSKVDRARVRHDHPELYIAVTGFVPMYNGISKLIIVDNQRATYDIATYAQTNAIVVSSLLSHDRTPVDFDIERSAEWTTRLLMVNTLVRDVTGLVCELHDIPLVYLRDDDDSPVLPSPTSIDDTVAARLTDIIASFTNDTFVYRHRWTRKNVTWLSRKKAGPCAFSTSRTHSRRPAYIRLTEDGSVRFTCNCEAKIRHADKHPPVVICNINDLTTPELTIEQINASLEYAVASPPTVNEPVELVNELVVEPTDASPPATVNAPVEFVEPTDASPPATVNAPVDPVNELVVEPTDASPPATVNELVIEPTDASPVVDEPIDASPSVVVEPISDDDEDDGVNARPLQRRRLMPSSDSDDDLLVAPAQHPPPFGDLQYLFDATDSPPHMPAAAAHDDEDEHDDDGQLMPAEIALKDRLNPRMDPATKDMLIGPYRVTVAGMSVVTKKSVSQAAENDYETILLFAQVFAARNIVIINDKTKTGFIWEDINQLWVPFTEATMRMLLPTIMLPVLRHRMGHARDDGPMEHALVVRNQYNCHHIAYKVPQRNAKKKAKGDDQYGKLVNNISRISKMSAITTGLVGFVHNPSFLSTVNKNEFFLPIQHGKAVDLRNGQIVSRNRFALAFTHELPYKYTPMSSFPNVDKFVMSICAGDVALFEYIHLICGYFLTGNVEGRSLFIAYGVGRNGKSTLVNTISKVMGQFAGTISESIFTDSAR